MNRKLCLLMLIVSSLLILAACSNGSEKAADLNDFLITQGVSLTCEMDELAESEEYLALMTSSETLGQVVKEMASQDYSSPENVYIVKLPTEVLLQGISGLSDDLKFSDSLLEKLKYKINGTVLANMINATYGSETVAATSMTAWGKSYIQPKGWSDNTMLLPSIPERIFQYCILFTIWGWRY